MRWQCQKCPWKTSTDPFDIPAGYCPIKHANLRNTIASGIQLGGTLRVMACHESKLGKELPCVGWLAHQLGPGNNILLRIRAMRDRSLTDFELVGEQHERFEDTLPEER